jgi:hypothetical protein
MSTCEVYKKRELYINALLSARKPTTIVTEVFQMKLKNKLANVVLKNALRSAQIGCGADSAIIYRQPKEPANLAERLEEMKKCV